MSVIKNLIDEPERSEDDAKDKEKNEPRPILKTATDLQRLKLEKLMKNPEKEIIIPEMRKEKDYMNSVPTFVRNVMGSSAGAGSGEFHVYRHLRRKEYARQKTIQAKSMKEQLDQEYHEKLENNRRIAEEKTAKKRAKRLKKKNNKKNKKNSSHSTEKQTQLPPEISDDSSDNESIQGEENLTNTDKVDLSYPNDSTDINEEMKANDELPKLDN
ncbi:PRKR-interacting protein 1 homolog [Teleopsis dalmanni]|uniref:PRKR-interacting protein 1 homolog n=1 Tax=Teleopsis dalmanni TaxID=139649 RepID=UPI0018CD4E83|nr:PRKR-interacting protein 1 homolog [Teleopsis dalmanni]